MVQRLGHCLGHELGEIVVSVMTPITRSGTERPREPLLQLYIGFSCCMCRIGGRLGTRRASVGGAPLGIPPLRQVNSNPRVIGETVYGG